MKQIDFVLRGPNASGHIQTDLLQNFHLTKSIHPIVLRADMTGIIPEEEEEEQLLYDDVGEMDEIYEELPGLIRHVNIRSCRFGRHFIDPVYIVESIAFHFALIRRCLPSFHQRRTCQTPPQKWSQSANLLLLLLILRLLLQVNTETM